VAKGVQRFQTARKEFDARKTTAIHKAFDRSASGRIATIDILRIRFQQTSAMRAIWHLLVRGNAIYGCPGKRPKVVSADTWNP
jgi:hypothetical protein